jgi:hypothetical protein
MNLTTTIPENQICVSKLTHFLADYYFAGLHVFPVKADKTPAVRSWKKIADAGQTFAEFSDMIWNLSKDATGIALALGVGQHPLVARDFDTPTSYVSFCGQYPDLARTLPTSRTHRGCHIFFRSDKPVKTKRLGDGELRGVGSYVIVPPSAHPSGDYYQWIHPLPIEVSEVPIVSPDVFVEAPAKDTASSDDLSSPSESPTDTQQLIPTSDTHRCYTLNCVSAQCVSSPPAIPTGIGQRHHWIWAFVRWAKSQGMELEDAGELFQAEWQKALPHIGTKDWATSYRDFAMAWNRCRPYTGAGSLTAAEAQARILPPMLPAMPLLDALGKLCHALAEQGNGTFFLSARDAQKHVGYSTPMVALRGLRRLCAMGLIECTKTGTAGVKHGGKASEYRWKGGGK